MLHLALVCRERAAHKRLKRAVQKEKRGAMRELRKDAAFIAAEKDKVAILTVLLTSPLRQATCSSNRLMTTFLGLRCTSGHLFMLPPSNGAL